MRSAFLLLCYLLKIHRASASEAPALLSDAVAVVEHNPPLFSGEYGKLKTLLVVIEWAERESAGKKSAVGKAGDCGRLQLLFPPARKGHTCKELQQEGVLDLELGLQWMLAMKTACNGSSTKALAAYARGACDSKKGMAIVNNRFHEIQTAVPSFKW